MSIKVRIEIVELESKVSIKVQNTHSLDQRAVSRQDCGKVERVLVTFPYYCQDPSVKPV